MIEVEEYFNKNFNFLEEETIIQMNNHFGMGELNNVIVGLNKECFGLILVDDENQITYQIFYVNGTKRLKGNVLQLSMEQNDRDGLVFAFVKYLSENYDDIDVIETFNVYQHHVRTLFEKLNYLTINPLMFQDHKGETLMIAKGVKGVLPVLMLDKKFFYEMFFDKKEKMNLIPGDEFIYLMLNLRNSLVKIGLSKNPNFREKTLQSEEPEIGLITFWKAPKQVERELHKQFKDKRQRGEWFKLSFSDLKTIKNQMKIYK